MYRLLCAFWLQEICICGVQSQHLTVRAVVIFRMQLFSHHPDTPVSRCPTRGRVFRAGAWACLSRAPRFARFRRALSSARLRRCSSVRPPPPRVGYAAPPLKGARSFGRTALAARESGRAIALLFNAVSATPSAFTAAGGGWVQTRLGDRSGHEPCPCRARTIPAPLALDADLMLTKSIL